MIAVIDRRSGIEANVEGLVDRHHKRNRVRDRFLGQLLAINRQYAGATFAWARSVVFEVEHDRVFARLERTTKQVLAYLAADATFPPVSF